MDFQSEPLVTVVTPVHNGETYLSQCIESVLAQTYQNWEYVIVNNRSTDRTLELAQQYAAVDARMRIHSNQEFVGMAANHNIAFRQMSPESRYCKVVHADDWLFPECIQRMIEVAAANPSVGIVGAYGLCGDIIRWDGLPYPSTVVPGREVCRRTLLGGFYVFGSPTSHLIRSDLIRNRAAYYNTNEFHAQFSDQEACYEALQHSDFGFVHQVLTYSRTHSNSATSLFAKTGFSTDLPSFLNILTKYGPIYLTQAEYERCLKKVMRKYYGFLSRAIFSLRSREFWNYHRRALDHNGYPLSQRALVKALFLELIDTLLNPKPIAATLLSKISRFTPSN